MTQLQGYKSPFQSVTMLGAGLTFLSPMFVLFNVVQGLPPEFWQGIASAGTAIVAGITTIVGRFRATKKVTTDATLIEATKP